MVEEYWIQGRRASEIAASVEDGIATGALPPGAALPPVRGLAERLGVNPHTVAAAYRTLRDRGVIETAGRRGTRVRHRLHRPRLNRPGEHLGHVDDDKVLARLA